QPTVTDADAVLGYLPLEGFAGGRMTLDLDGARDAVQRDIAEPLGLDVVEAAWGIERIVNANMANATRRVLASHGADARELALIDVGLFAQMGYRGQNVDMSVPVPEGDTLDEPGLLDLTERFHDQHEADRGFCFRNQQPLLRGVRLVARGYTPKPERLAPLGAVREAKAARRGERRVYFGPEFMGSGFVDAPVYD